MKKFFVVRNTDPELLGDLLYMRFNIGTNTVEIDFTAQPGDIPMQPEEIPELIAKLMTAGSIMVDRIRHLQSRWEQEVASLGVPDPETKD